MSERRVTIVSNRLPVRVEQTAGGWVSRRSDGGLVAALEPVLRARGGTWVGWAGTRGGHAPGVLAELWRYGRGEGFDLFPVELSADEHETYYEGACNEALWPLLHGLLEQARVSHVHAGAYRAVNQRFAEAVARSGSSGTVWVHDYHLLQMGEALRRRLPGSRLGFFFHTPFPETEIIQRLPWGRSLLRSLACFDVIGFQTQRDRRNFLDWATALGFPAHVAGLGSRTGVFPISVDWGDFHRGAGTPEVLARARVIREEQRGRKIVLGVDRLDYTKGLPHRLIAWERMLESRPGLLEEVVLVQLAVPSRTGIAEYRRLAAEVEALVERINARFGRGDWQPVRYVYGTWDRSELLAWYVAADVAAVTPLRDGMNLVAKEFVAASRGEGVLVLSPGAGAADELSHGALVADPLDTQTLAETIAAALEMSGGERRMRLEALQARLREHDVHRWAESFLTSLREASGGPRAPHRMIRWGGLSPARSEVARRAVERG